MSNVAKFSRWPCGLLLTLTLIIQLTSAQFPDQFELNSFLYNAPPKTFEADFFRGGGARGKSNSALAMAAASPPALRSQNRKFLAKTPEHDKHFATILRQQEAATIRDPSQAAMVADDQMVLKGRGVSHSLQTSDDDVYEVESAPMEMKSPYRPRGFHGGGHQFHRGGFPPNPHAQSHFQGYHRRAQFPAPEALEASEPEENEGEGGAEGGSNDGGGNDGGGHTGLPVSVSFESNIDHSAYEAPEQPDQPEQQQQNQHRQNNNDDDDWASPRHKIMPLDGDPDEPPFNSGFRPPPPHHRGGGGGGGGKPRGPSSSMGQQNMHFSMGVSNDEGSHGGGGGDSYRPPVRGHQQQNSGSSSFQHQQQPYTHIQYMHMMPASMQSSPPEHKPRGGGGGGYRGPSSSSSDEFRSPDWGPSPALHEQSRAQHEREIFGAPPVAGSKLDLGKAPMESSWLDMGAYSSGKGAFGWYSDVPVAGGNGAPGGGGHQIMHKK